jgi:hypothetical protein
MGSTSWSREIAASYYLAILKSARAQYSESEELCLRIIERVGEDVGRTVQAVVALPASGARCVRAFICSLRGDFVDGIRHGNDSLRIAESNRHSYTVTYSLMTLSFLYAEKGDVVQAASICERGLCVWEKPGSVA